MAFDSKSFVPVKKAYGTKSHNTTYYNDVNQSLGVPMHTFEYYIPDHNWNRENPFKKDWDEVYNDIYDLENNIVYREEKEPDIYVEEPFTDYSDYIDYSSSDEEETNEWMFNM